MKNETATAIANEILRCDFMAAEAFIKQFSAASREAIVAELWNEYHRLGVNAK